VAQNQEALDKATAMRTKGLAEFVAEEKDVLQSISALKAAITVLSKHNSAFLQTDTEVDAQATVLKQAADGIQHVLQNPKNAQVLDQMISGKQQRLLESFVQARSTTTGKKMISSKNAGTQPSGEIFGMLKQMLESFESNLSQSQKEEAESQTGFEDLKAAKDEEIAAGQDQIGKKTQELASTDEKLATNKVDLADTTDSLAADREFLANLKEQCQSLDEEWEFWRSISYIQ
jgi:chromosome segregation ATPase